MKYVHLIFIIIITLLIYPSIKNWSPIGIKCFLISRVVNNGLVAAYFKEVKAWRKRERDRREKERGGGRKE